MPANIAGRFRGREGAGRGGKKERQSQWNSSVELAATNLHIQRGVATGKYEVLYFLVCCMIIDLIFAQ